MGTNNVQPIEGYSGNLANPLDAFGKAVQLMAADIQYTLNKAPNITAAKAKLQLDDYKKIFGYADTIATGNKSGKLDTDDMVGVINHKLVVVQNLEKTYKEYVAEADYSIAEAKQNVMNCYYEHPKYKEKILAAGGKIFLDKVNAGDADANKAIDQILDDVYTAMTDKEHQTLEACKEKYFAAEDRRKKMAAHLDMTQIYIRTLQAASYQVTNKKFEKSSPIDDLLNQFYQLAEVN